MIAVKPVILWTDALLYLLVVVVAIVAIQSRRKEHLRAPWRYVSRQPLGMAAVVVLASYVAVGLLDSVHFRLPLADVPPRAADGAQRIDYSIEVLSLFDVMVTPLRARVEKTYSAPFATHLYAKETLERADGTTVREHPRLQYGGAHLADPAAERPADVFWTSMRALAWGGAAWGFVIAAALGWQARRRGISIGEMSGRMVNGRTELPWRTLLATLGVLILLGFLMATLGVKYHVLGTNKVGQDVLYQSLKSIRTGLVIGTLTTLVMLPFAVALGTMAGYFRGWVDDVIQYLYTTLNSIPGVLLIAAAILILQGYLAAHPEQFDTVAARADMRLLFLCVILGITSWTGLCRLLRGETFKLREMDYIQAAVAYGAGHVRVLRRHIVPNVMHIVLITVALDFSGLVLAEAVLSYVGVGVDPTTISWGTMINGARLEMAREPMVWWSLLAAFTFMFTLVLAANLFSDTVRDAFDPRLKPTAEPSAPLA